MAKPRAEKPTQSKSAGRPRRSKESILGAAARALMDGMGWWKFASAHHPERNLTPDEVEKLRARFARGPKAPAAAAQPKSKPAPAKPVKATKPGKPELYDSILARSSAHILEASRKGRDIGPPPPIVNRPRRDAAFKSLHAFLTTYFQPTFHLPFGSEHIELIGRVQTAIEQGGLLALACPRGWGKSSIIDRAGMWSVLTGRCRYVAIVGASERHAEKSLSRIKSEFEHNGILRDDFPKACYPIHKLESQSRRCVGQLMDGVRTEITWQRKELILPTAGPPDNEASGAVLAVAGITGAIRGLSHIDTSGKTYRPDLLLVDDPQDRDSAGSVVQTSMRLQVLCGDCLNLAGPGNPITCIVPTTIIYPNDLAHQLLDQERHPEWNGRIYKMVNRWPTNMGMWEQYMILRKKDPSAADFLYATNRAAMDEGADVPWAARFGPGELSALQSAFNLRVKIGEEAFQAEMQQSPIQPVLESARLDPVLIAKRTNGTPRYVVPGDCELVTAAIDPGQELLWYAVVAWSEDFSASVIDYGCHPPQSTRTFLARNASPSLGQVYPGGVSASVYRGLRALLDELLARSWQRVDGATLKLARILVDRGWESDTVIKCISHHPNRDVITPSKGEGFGPAKLPIAEYQKRQGERLGRGFILKAADSATRLRYLRFDSDVIKSTVADMLARPMGEQGIITLYGDSASEHELLASHLASETPVATTAMGRTVAVWTQLPNRANHLLDVICGCVTAASMEGISPLTSIGGKVERRPRKIRSFAAEHAEGLRRFYEGNLPEWARPRRPEGS
jgi:hypothetical protein